MTKTLNTFRILLKEDVKASTAIRDPNIAGSSSLQLSWIWQTQTTRAESGLEMMRECECPASIIFFINKNFITVVSSMCTLVVCPGSKEPMARRAYSTEIRDGMDNQVFFTSGPKMADMAERHKLRNGARAYVARQAAQWLSLALDAEQFFVRVNREYVRIM